MASFFRTFHVATFLRSRKSRPRLLGIGYVICGEVPFLFQQCY